MLHCKYCKNSVVVYLLISTPITHKTLPTFTGMWWGNMQRLNQGANSFYRKCLMLTWYLMLTAFWLAGRWEERTRPKSLQERCRASLNTCWEERRTSPWRLITSSPTPRFSTFLESLKASWIQVRAEAAPVLRTRGRVGVPCELRVCLCRSLRGARRSERRVQPWVRQVHRWHGAAGGARHRRQGHDERWRDSGHAQSGSLFIYFIYI